MIIPIYSDDLFELITLAEIDAQFLHHGHVYRMIPEYDMPEVLPRFDDSAPLEMQVLKIIEVRLEVFRRSKDRHSLPQETFVGFALCDDAMALRIRAAFAPGQVAHASRELSWISWRLQP